VNTHSFRSDRGEQTAPTAVATLGEAGGEEFAEPVPEYLRDGYRSLMAGDARTAIRQWKDLYDLYPSAELCSHLARAHFFATYFGSLNPAEPRVQELLKEMRMWAERALQLNPNSSTGHAMVALALGRMAQGSGSQRQLVRSAAQVYSHAMQAVRIDNNWVGHYVLGMLHREIATVPRSIRLLAGLLLTPVPDASYEQSIKHFNEVLRQYPTANIAYAELAYTYQRLGQLDTARTMLKRALAMPLFKHPIAAYFTHTAAETYRRWFGSVERDAA